MHPYQATRERRKHPRVETGNQEASDTGNDADQEALETSPADMVVETSPVDMAMETETLKLKRNWSPGKKPQETLHPIKKFEIQQRTVTPKYKSLSGHKTTNDDAKTRTRLRKYNSIAQKYAQDKAEAQGRLDDGTTPKKSFKELVPRDYWDFQDIFDPDKAK